MSQTNTFVEANAPPPYKNEVARTMLTPQPLHGAMSYHPQPSYPPTATRTLQRTGIQPAYTASPHVHTVIECQPVFVRSQPVASMKVQDNTTGPHVPDKMLCSLLNMICGCCWLGVPAVILASQANSLRTSYPHKALAKARAARTLNIAGLVIEFVAAMIILVIWSKSNYSHTG